MNHYLKKQGKIIKVLLSRNPNCSGYAGYFLILGFSVIQYFSSCVGGYILYHYFSRFHPERLEKQIKRAKRATLILLVFLFFDLLLRNSVKFFPRLEEFLVSIFPIEDLILFSSIPFGIFLGISLWNLKLFQKNPKLRFIVLPLIIWWGMLLYIFILFLF